jgi:hypothetical protein
MAASVADGLHAPRASLLAGVEMAMRPWQVAAESPPRRQPTRRATV